VAQAMVDLARLNFKIYLADNPYSPVDTGVLNEKKQAPVHLATELNKVKSLRVMGQYRNVIDIQQGGEHGRTALHLAAIYDHEECARILVSGVSFGQSFHLIIFYVRPCFFIYSCILFALV